MAYYSSPEMDQKALSLIQTLASSSADTQSSDTWYCIAACAFAASNQGKYVADVYRAAIGSQPDNVEFHKHVLRRIKESLLKTGIIYGVPRVINAFRALITAIPGPDSNEIVSIRDHIQRPAETNNRGLEYMRNVFQADLDPMLITLDTYWPDLRTLIVTYIYGYYQSDVTVIDAITTSQLNIATLVPMDVTSEVGWHMRGLIRNGGSLEQLRWTYETGKTICEICEVQLKNKMPTAEEVINEERLF